MNRRIKPNKGPSSFPPTGAISQITFQRQKNNPLPPGYHCPQHLHMLLQPTKPNSGRKSTSISFANLPLPLPPKLPHFPPPHPSPNSTSTMINFMLNSPPLSPQSTPPRPV